MKDFAQRMLKLFVMALLVILTMPVSIRAQTAESSAIEDNAAKTMGAERFIYRQVGERSLKAFVFSPKTKGNGRPAILLFHGGAWQLADASGLFGRAKEFSDKGLVAIAVDYSLANDGRTPIDSVDDTCAAFAWARQHAAEFGIDTNRVVGYGWSAGGHLVAAAATLPAIRERKITPEERPNVLMLYSPALNMAKDPFFTRIMLGKADPALYSPSEYISRSLPPTLILQGEEDTIVYTKDARAFCDAAQKSGVRCELHIYPGVGHLLTRNLKVQYRDFDADPKFAKEAHELEDAFLVSLGYMH
ncbi:MAG TPA: alpha/beta hydrolase [Edaphobacter sp.]|jgi:acetyl esterase/lipase|nr:alpha/beta hydrolase [Edaphobacter sp.]